jgi:hypothetical protein
VKYAWVALVCACGPDAAKVCQDPKIAADLGVVGTADADLTETDGKKFLNVPLNADPAPDQLQLELYPQVGVFAGGAVRPGTYSLDDAETKFSTCGACALLYQDVSADTGKPAGFFMPLAGTLVLTSTEGRLVGALENVVFRHVSIDFFDPDGTGPSLETTTIDDGCTVFLERAAFDLELPPTGPQ